MSEIRFILNVKLTDPNNTFPVQAFNTRLPLLENNSGYPFIIQVVTQHLFYRNSKWLPPYTLIILTWSLREVGYQIKKKVITEDKMNFVAICCLLLFIGRLITIKKNLSPTFYIFTGYASGSSQEYKRYKLR